MITAILSFLAALALLAVGVYAAGKKRTAANGVLLSVTALLSGIEIFDQLSLLLDGADGTFRRISLYLESLLPGAFLLLSVVHGRIRPFEKLSKIRMGMAGALAFFPAILLFLVGNDLYYSPDFPSDRMLFLENAGYWYYMGIMLSFVVALVNVEATFVATHGMDRNRMKFEAFGIMSLLAVLIFYYSQGFLYRTINMNLVPVRSSVFIISALLIGYSRAFRGSNVRVTISRHVLYRSAALLAIGCYLLGLGLIGEGMRYFGETFGRNVAIVIAFAGGILLLAVLFSDKARRRAKVYISKHFYANKHDYREEWIKLNNRLSSCATLPDVQEAILTAYQETFGLAGASLFMLDRDEKRYVLAGEHNMPEVPAEFPISEALRDYFVKRERVLNLEDGEYPLSEPGRAVFTQARAWIVVPLISNSRIEGLAMLREQIVPELLIYDDIDLMKVIARQAAHAVANLKLSEEVMEMRAMATVSRISAFVIHDLKNLMSSLSLVVDNAGEHIGNPEFQQDAMATIRDTLAKMKGLTQRLKTIPEKNALASNMEDINRLSRETVADFARMRTGAQFVYNGSDGTPILSCVDGEEIKKVIVNLVQNAFEASGEQGPVMVETREEKGSVCIRVSDFGVGMTEDFMKNHLFRPFRTTKAKGLGVGLYQCRQIVEAHGGRLEAQSTVGKGTVFTLSLPPAESAATGRRV